MKSMKPKNIEEVFKLLKEKADPEELKQWTAMTENKATASVHFTIGRWIRNNLGLWTGKSNLAKYMKKLGLQHPDDMSGLILSCYHRHLNNKPFNIQKEVEEYKQYWAKNDSSSHTP